MTRLIQLVDSLGHLSKLWVGEKGGGRFRVGLRNHTSLFCHWRHWQADLTAIGQCGELMFGLASRFENSLATVARGKKVFSPPLIISN